MTEILVFGDTHVGYEQYNLPERRRDFADAFERVVDNAIEAGVDAVVHTGDLFHTSDEQPQEHLFIIDQLSRLVEAGIPFFGVVGNHDDARSGQWLDWYDRTNMAHHLGRESVVVGDDPAVALFGQDYVPQSRRDEIDYEFAAPETVADLNGVPVAEALVTHGRFAPLVPGSWDLREVLSASNRQFDVALLGDEHDPVEATVGGVPAVYAGATERTATDQTAERGFYIAEFTAADGDGGVDMELTRETIDVRPLVSETVELGPDDGLPAVEDTIRGMSVDGAIAEVVLRGQGGGIRLRDVEERVESAGALKGIARDRRDGSGHRGEGDDLIADGVTFEDPDARLEERLDDHVVPPVVGEVDELIREGDVAKTNLDEKVADVLAERVEETPADFNTTTPANDSDSGEPGTDAEPNSDAVGDGGTTMASGDASEGEDEATASSESGSAVGQETGDEGATDAEAVGVPDSGMNSGDSSDDDESGDGGAQTKTLGDF